jgi:fructose-specific phosphotransferase system IIC component
LGGIGWWDVGAALVALPLITLAVSAVIFGAYRRWAPASLERRHAICSGPACVLSGAVIGVAIALTIATPVNEVAIWSGGAWMSDPAGPPTRTIETLYIAGCRGDKAIASRAGIDGSIPSPSAQQQAQPTALTQQVG